MIYLDLNGNKIKDKKNYKIFLYCKFFLCNENDNIQLKD